MATDNVHVTYGRRARRQIDSSPFT